MKTLDEFKESLQENIFAIESAGKYLFTNYPEPFPQFVSVTDIKVNHSLPLSSELTIAENDNQTQTISLQTAINNQYELCIKGKKIEELYDYDKAKNLYYLLVRFKDKLFDINKAEIICDRLEELGKEEARKIKLSKLGNHYVNNENITSNIVTRFQSEFATKFSPDDFIDFKEAYVLGYEGESVNVAEEKKEKVISRRQAKDAIKNSYSGDIDELINWIKTNIEYISVSIPKITLDDYDNEITGKNGKIRTIAEIKEATIQNTLELIDEAEELGLASSSYIPKEGNGLYSTWKAKLKPSAKDTKPKEVDDWTILKKLPSDLDDYEDGKVYRERQSMLTGNPIIKDLIFEYQFKLN